MDKFLEQDLCFQADQLAPWMSHNRKKGRGDVEVAEACLGLLLWSRWSYLIVHKSSQEAGHPPMSPCDSLLIGDRGRERDTEYPEGSMSDEPDPLHLGRCIRAPPGSNSLLRPRQWSSPEHPHLSGPSAACPAFIFPWKETLAASLICKTSPQFLGLGFFSTIPWLPSPTRGPSPSATPLWGGVDSPPVKCSHVGALGTALSVH